MGRFREVVEGLRAPPCTFPTQTGAQGALERRQPTLSMLLEEELDPPKTSENRLECANIALGVENLLHSVLLTAHKCGVRLGMPRHSSLTHCQVHACFMSEILCGIKHV